MSDFSAATLASLFLGFFRLLFDSPLRHSTTLIFKLFHFKVNFLLNFSAALEMDEAVSVGQVLQLFSHYSLN
jgi:hypothetical protein